MTARLPFAVRLAFPAVIAAAGLLGSGGSSAQDLRTTPPPEPTTKDLDTSARPTGTVPLTPSVAGPGRPGRPGTVPGPATRPGTGTGTGTESATGPAHHGGATVGSSEANPGSSAPESSGSAGVASAVPSAGEGLAPGAGVAAVGLQTVEKRTIPLGIGNVALTLKVPVDWAELDAASLPAVDIAGTGGSPDVSVLVRRGFGVHQPAAKPPVLQEVVVVCGRAPGSYWGDNIRDAAFTQMLSAVEKEVGRYSTVRAIEPEPVRTVGERFEQSFSAEGDFGTDRRTEVAATGKGKTRSASLVKLQGVSFLGFHADRPDSKSAIPAIVACSVACVTLVSAAETGVCPVILGSMQVEGAFVPPPKRSRFAELLFALRRDPTTAWLLGIGGVLAILIVITLLLVVTRRRRHAAHDDGLDLHDPHDPHDGFGDHADDDRRVSGEVAVGGGSWDEGYRAGLAAARNAASNAAPLASPGGNPAGVHVGAMVGAMGVVGAVTEPEGGPRAPSASESMHGVGPLSASPPPIRGYFDPATLRPWSG